MSFERHLQVQLDRLGRDDRDLDDDHPRSCRCPECDPDYHLELRRGQEYAL
ncbi:hypothetical protein [Prescottella equi]|uniref:hypothetical protein n=1 Tax=Rhodococcus hoagii TaxID=43767 RepID=UPI0023D9C318|nr:hypothetical protein [Prescottella equi]